MRADGEVLFTKHPGGCRVHGYLTGHTALGSLLIPATGFDSSALRFPASIVICANRWGNDFNTKLAEQLFNGSGRTIPAGTFMTLGDFEEIMKIAPQEYKMRNFDLPANQAIRWPGTVLI